MTDPAKSLPNCSSDDIAEELFRIGFPPAQNIKPFNSDGAFHKIYLLGYTVEDYDLIVAKVGLTSAPGSHGSNASFILRISGPHMPQIKTANEVGIINYLTQKTSIPLPHIVHYDDTDANHLHSEYMIMSLLVGNSASAIYPTLSQSQMSHILDQLADICLEIYKLDFNHIGGLKPNLDTESTKFPQRLLDLPTTNGPPMFETMWFQPDIDKCFAQESTASLNAIATNGYPSYTSWLADQLRVYIHAIKIHNSLTWILESDPNLTTLTHFQNMLETDTTLQSKLNDIPLKLAHRDLHFGNILLSPSPISTLTSSEPEVQYTITGILDWEFACILPFPLWRHSFLWDGMHTPPPTFNGTKTEFATHSRRERDRLYGIWCQKVRGRGGELGSQVLRDAEWRCKEQERAWDVVNYLRCVVEVCPRGVQEGDARAWWKEVVMALKEFGVEIGIGM